MNVNVSEMRELCGVHLGPFYVDLDFHVTPKGKRQFVFLLDDSGWTGSRADFESLARMMVEDILGFVEEPLWSARR